MVAGVNLASYAILVLAIASVSITLTRSHIAEWIRFHIDELPDSTFKDWTYDLFSCPWCMSHWVAVPLVWTFLIDPWPDPLVFLLWLFATTMLTGLVFAFYGALVKLTKD